MESFCQHGFRNLIHIFAPRFSMHLSTLCQVWNFILAYYAVTLQTVNGPTNEWQLIGNGDVEGNQYVTTFISQSISHSLEGIWGNEQESTVQLYCVAITTEHTVLQWHHWKIYASFLCQVQIPSCSFNEAHSVTPALQLIQQPALSISWSRSWASCVHCLDCFNGHFRQDLRHSQRIQALVSQWIGVGASFYGVNIVFVH